MTTDGFIGYFNLVTILGTVQLFGADIENKAVFRIVQHRRVVIIIIFIAQQTLIVGVSEAFIDIIEFHKDFGYHCIVTGKRLDDPGFWTIVR